MEQADDYKANLPFIVVNLQQLVILGVILVLFITNNFSDL